MALSSFLLRRALTLTLSSSLVKTNRSFSAISSSSSSSSSHLIHSHHISSSFIIPRRFSSNRNNNGGDDSTRDPNIPNTWKISSQDDDNGDSIFDDDGGGGDLSGFADDHSGFDDGLKKVPRDSRARDSSAKVDSWTMDSSTKDDDVFADFGAEKVSGDTWAGDSLTRDSSKNEDSWAVDSSTKDDDVFADFGSEKVSGDSWVSSTKDVFGSEKGGAEDEWKTAEGYQPWSFGEEEKSEVFEIGDVQNGITDLRDEAAEREMAEAKARLEKEKDELSVHLKGPNRAFGDLIAASGITDEMLDSLIALKDLEGIEGLPPLSVIEDIRLEKNERKSTNAELERKKQEEIAKSRVRMVDEKGRSYGTGRRKCSIARVWIQPGEGKFIINDKPFDTYFPLLDHRADLLRPFSETQTLGLWDVTCTVKGGGVSGQVGAVRLGVSRALQNWEPGLRPNLRSAGFLTRDSRVVERKKPGKAKARKSFQWVKR